MSNEQKDHKCLACGNEVDINHNPAVQIEEKTGYMHRECFDKLVNKKKQ